jgi:hypothetical protein
MLHNTARQYRITNAGAKALRAKASVPAWYRAVLAHIDASGSVPAARSRTLGRHPAHRIRMWLDEMETLGFIEAVTVGPSLQAKYAPYAKRLPELQSIIDKLTALRATQ